MNSKFLTLALLTVALSTSPASANYLGRNCTLYIDADQLDAETNTEIRDILARKDFRLVSRPEDAEFVLWGHIQFACILSDEPLSNFQEWMQSHFYSAQMATYHVKLTQKKGDEPGASAAPLFYERGSRTFARAPRKFMRIIRRLENCDLVR